MNNTTVFVLESVPGTLTLFENGTLSSRIVQVGTLSEWAHFRCSRPGATGGSYLDGGSFWGNVFLARNFYASRDVI